MSIKWLNYPVLAAHEGGDTFYADVVNHCIKRDKFVSLLTEAHEVSHFIHSDIRNAQSGKVNAFYVGESMAAVVNEPKIRKRDVASYIPASLRGYRFPTYISRANDWDDRPLYIWDEWSSYANGGYTGVDFVERGDYKADWTDGVSGILEFTIYAACLGMAVKDKDVASFNDPQFSGFMEWQSLRCEAIYMKGSLMSAFKWETQDKMLVDLRNSEDASRLRAFLVQHCGGAFLERTPPPDPDLLDKNMFDLVGD